jgi:hypothetical protein
MVEKRQDEWRELEEKTIRLLSNPNLLPIDAIAKYYQPILRLWIYPSLSSFKVWIFCEPDFRTTNKKDLIVCEVTWDRNADYKRLANPLEGLKKGFDSEPRLEIKSLEIEREIFDEIFSELKHVQFTAFANNTKTIHVDGVRCGIEAFDFTHRTSISWWCDSPDEWRNLFEWFEKTTDFLQAKFSEIN